MNGSHHYGHVDPNQPIPQPAPGMPFPPGVPGTPSIPGVTGVTGVPFEPYTRIPPPQPPMASLKIPEREHMNNGHHSISYPLHPMLINQENYISSTGDRYYTPYNTRLPEENHAPPPVQYRTFVPPGNVPIYNQDAPLPREDRFTPLPPEMHPDYRVNANSYGPRPDVVWAPNLCEMFTFGDMRNTLPPPPPPPLAAEEELEEGMQALERRIVTDCCL